MISKRQLILICGVMLLIGSGLGWFVSNARGQAKNEAAQAKSAEKTGKNSEQIATPMFRTLFDSLQAVEDEVPAEDKQKYKSELEKIQTDIINADRILTRIKEENAKALQRANEPVKIRNIQTPEVRAEQEAKAKNSPPAKDAAKKAD